MLKLLKKWLKNPLGWITGFWHRNWLSKLVAILVGLVILLSIAIFGIGEWYIHTQADQPLNLGVSFIPDYASSLGLNPEATMKSLIDIGVKNFRLVSYWSDIEPEPGQYDFSQLDWQFRLAEQAHAKILLSIGLRQPRWPECHAPSWVNTSEPDSQWEGQLRSFMAKVIERYKNSTALSSYELENEYFLKGFGDCTNFDRQRFINEYHLVKQLDPRHPVIIARSNNTLGLPTGQPQPDEFGISIYLRVWDQNVTHRYLEYPYPAWYYGFLAGIQKIFLHKNMIIDELQAEAWPPNSQSIQQTSLKEQNKSLDAKRLKGRFEFGKATGMKTIYMWGAEYWYYRMVVLHDPSLWQVAKTEFKQT